MLKVEILLNMQLNKFNIISTKMAYLLSYNLRNKGKA